MVWNMELFNLGAGTTGTRHCISVLDASNAEIRTFLWEDHLSVNRALSLENINYLHLSMDFMTYLIINHVWEEHFGAKEQ